MKIKNVRRTAFFNLRLLIASLLCLTAGMLTLLAFAGTQQRDNNRQTTSSSRWLTRLASTLGISSPSKRFSTSSGAIKLDKYPAEPPSASSQRSAVRYRGAPQHLTPVTPVRTRKLRDTAPIDP